MHEWIAWLGNVLPRLLASGLLLSVALLCVSETVRLWSRGPWTVSPFAFFEKGVENKQEGAGFANQVLAEFFLQEELLRNTQQSFSSEVTASVAPRLPELTPVQLPQELLQNAEIKVQGVDIGSLARTVSLWINPPQEISGTVSKDAADKFSVQLLLRDRSQSGQRKPVALRTEAHATREAAITSTASQLLFEFVSQQTDVLNGLDRGSFVAYVAITRRYGALLSQRRERRISQADDKLETEALAQQIVDLSASAPKSLPVLRLLLFSDLDQKKYSAARQDIKQYLDLKADDEDILLVAKELDRLDPQTPQELVAAVQPSPSVASPPAEPPVSAEDLQNRSPAEIVSVRNPQLPRQRQWQRPLRPGISIGALGVPQAGTICCFVHRGSEVYALTSEHIFAGPEHRLVIQPAPLDGGDGPDQIGQLLELPTIRPGVQDLMGALVKVNVPWNAATAEGPMVALSPPRLGMQVICLGRTTGKTVGQVRGIDMLVTIEVDRGRLQRTGGLFEVAGLNGDFSAPGDSGAPILDAESHNLVGMLYAASETSSYCVPIHRLLQGWKVEPILGTAESPAP